MRKTIIATLAGIAIVAGGFFAGTLIDTDTAVAQEDPGVEAPAEEQREGPREHRRGDGPRGALVDMVETAADFLDMDVEEIKQALAGGSTLADLTDDVDGLVAALVASAEDSLDEAVEDGKIDAERAAEVGEALEERITEFVNSTHERPVRPHADRHIRGAVNEAAEAIGIEAQELVEGLRSGMTVVEVAEANSVSEAELIDALVESATERITEWVNKSFDGPAGG